MRYGVEVTVHSDYAPALLELTRDAGLTTDTEPHPRHCDCMPHVREHNPFHVTEDHGGEVVEWVSRVLDTDNLRDEFTVLQIEHTLRSLHDSEPVAHNIEVSTHVHVECKTDLFGAVTNIVGNAQDDINDGLANWLGHAPYQPADEQLRVVNNKLQGWLSWLPHPSQPMSANPELPFYDWLRLTTLGTVEFTFWRSFASDPHLADIVQMSVGVVEAACELSEAA